MKSKLSREQLESLLDILTSLGADPIKISIYKDNPLLATILCRFMLSAFHKSSQKLDVFIEDLLESPNDMSIKRGMGKFSAEYQRKRLTAIVNTGIDICIQNGERYLTQTLIEKKLGLNLGAVSKSIKINGYTWHEVRNKIIDESNDTKTTP